MTLLLPGTPSRRKAFILSTGFEAGLGVIALLLSLFMDESLFHRFIWTKDTLLISLPFVVPPALFFLLLVNANFDPFVRIRNVLDRVLLPIFGDSKLPDLLFISMVAGVGEEMLFRGVLQTSLDSLLGHPTGLFIAAFLFGIAHMLTPLYALIAGLAGFYLGLLYIWSGNLLVPIIVHGLYDFFALWYFLKFREGKAA